ncbi:hypothetical protein ASPACDRAFT_43016 [Aspergillus aculeatus ATCC 16872]|uniref:Peptidase S8/S53 domain-containing protein n=1 Tax=Aspergillus aculeatus (strain ATCC 16872 / CBS 172.66 / WB 5094) TaxID=690307 RepID=A0A1L9WW77_ASPA1|nr:uncharacterized protein ASPACDRAFT_43016 [Aspergillus aculeatus ATCC 16872]OJK00429.1 hypothetical protein ASPACDRAFT_43016 [Aspergillus aculeatus ATCC 16872]
MNEQGLWPISRSPVAGIGWHGWRLDKARFARLQSLLLETEGMLEFPAVDSVNLHPSLLLLVPADWKCGWGQRRRVAIQVLLSGLLYQMAVALRERFPQHFSSFRYWPPEMSCRHHLIQGSRSSLVLVALELEKNQADAAAVVRQKTSNILKLRGHYAECLFGLERFAEAESYNRETLRGWLALGKADGSKGAARTRVELAKCLREQQTDNDTHKLAEAIELLEVALDYWSTQPESLQQTKSVVELLADSSAQLLRHEDALKWDRRTLACLQQQLRQETNHHGNEGSIRENIIAVQIEIFKDLWELKRFEEAASVYKTVLRDGETPPHGLDAPLLNPQSEAATRLVGKWDDEAVEITPISFPGAWPEDEDAAVIVTPDRNCMRNEETIGEEDYTDEDGEATLFDCHDSQRSDATEKWMKDFSAFCKVLISYSRDENVKIRVAVLDTGIDGEHAFVKARWHRQELKDQGYQDFSAEPAGLDACDVDGHGTHVAGLILRFAPSVDLYVARIATRREDLRHDREIHNRVAKALRHAMDQWKVNIISMSFGLKQETSEINRLLRDAYNKGVVVFAAATNDGNRRSVAYPAKARSVFGIHAADGHCKPAAFTPNARNNDLNFSILGTNVLSTWPRYSNTQDAATKPSDVIDNKALHGSAKYMSGTSVATPISAALAANMLAYCEVNAAALNLKETLDNWECIRRLFKGMSVETGNYDILVPWEGARSRFQSYKTQFRNIISTTLNEDP